MDLFENQYVQIGIVAIAGLIIMLLRHFIMKESIFKIIDRPLGSKIIGALASIIVGLFILYLTNQLYIAIIVILTIQFLADLLIHCMNRDN